MRDRGGLTPLNAHRQLVALNLHCRLECPWQTRAEIAPTMSHKLPDGVHCPGCGGPVERQHRHAADRFFSIFVSLHRYRCLDSQCGWQGIVGRERAPPPAAPNWRSRLLWALVGAALAVAGMTPMLLIGRARPAAKPAAVASVAMARQETD